MAKVKMRGMKVKMWDGTSIAPKDKDGKPVKLEEYNVKFNASLMYDRRKR